MWRLREGDLRDHWVLTHQNVDPIVVAMLLQQLPLRSHMHFCAQIGHIGEQLGQAPIFHPVHCPQDQWQRTIGMMRQDVGGPWRCPTTRPIFLTPNVVCAQTIYLHEDENSTYLCGEESNISRVCV